MLDWDNDFQYPEYPDMICKSHYNTQPSDQRIQFVSKENFHRLQRGHKKTVKWLPPLLFLSILNNEMCNCYDIYLNTYKSFYKQIGYK